MIFERRYLPQALCSLELADNARYGLNTLYLGFDPPSPQEAPTRIPFRPTTAAGGV